MKKAGFLFSAFLILIFSVSAGAFLPNDTEGTLDILFQNGRVLDGTGNPCFYADVGIKGGKIVAVGRLQGKWAAEKVIDISGQIISPGFIDMHTHTDMELLINPNAESKIRQGITTEVGGNCGYAPFPLSEADHKEIDETNYEK